MTSPKRNDGPFDKGLIVFIKNPVLGKVKTRLAASVGDEEALQIYKLLLDHTKKVATSTHASKYLYYSNFIANDNWNPHTFTKRLQSGDDLGARMMKAIEEVLKEKSKAVIIGSDCPQLSPEILEDAFEALEKFDIVTGPTYDGGYYLIGMKAIHPTLFQNMTWSVRDVFAQTLLRIQRLGLSNEVLEMLSDIDTIEDWKKYKIS